MIGAPIDVPKDSRLCIVAKESPHSASKVDVGEVFSNFLDSTRLVVEASGHSTGVVEQLDCHFHWRAIATARTTSSSLGSHRAKIATCFPKIY